MFDNRDPVGGSNSSYDKMKRNLGRLKKIVSKNSPTTNSKIARQQEDHSQDNSNEDIMPVGSFDGPVEICKSFTENEPMLNDGETTRLEPENSEYLPFKFTPGARMGSTLLYSIKEKQLYRLNKEINNCKRYVCIVKDCRAALFLKENELIRSPSFNGHNHADQEAVAAKNRFETTCKAKCLEGDANPSVVFTSMLSE